MIFEIASTSNSKYKYIKSLLQKKNRVKNGVFCAEGIKSVKDALASDFEIECIAVSRSFYESGGINENDGTIYVVEDNIFPALCDTQTPQGILSVIRMKQNILPHENGRAYVYCDHISDPGNLGTIIRTADAGALDGVILSPECADMYSPKTVRAAMGSVFHIPVYENVTAEQLSELKNAGYRILSADLSDNTIDYRTADYSGSVIVALGNEANGISGGIKEISDCFVKIPILGRAESLNVSAAGAVLIYEMVRTRVRLV